MTYFSLFRATASAPPAIPAELRAVPDWLLLQQELKRKGVTLALLRDYKAGRSKTKRERSELVIYPG